MEYAARLPKAPSRRNLVAPLVALLVGAGVATGAYALIDDGNSTTSPAKVIVVEQPAEGSAAIPGKDEAATAAALSGTSGIVPRGSKASATAGHPSSGGVSAAGELRADPHGTAISLRNP
jgi:hypothetical protein